MANQSRLEAAGGWAGATAGVWLEPAGAAGWDGDIASVGVSGGTSQWAMGADETRRGVDLLLVRALGAATAALAGGRMIGA